MSNVQIEKSYYPNGRIRGECHLADGKPVGITRLWHENGVLSWECPFEEGLENGLVRQWDENGKLLGEYYMQHGTGTSKSWYQNGQLERESSAINGKLCGRFRCWDEVGKLISTGFYILDKKVSKRKYVEVCETDPTLPRYQVDESKSESAKTNELPNKLDTPTKATSVNYNKRETHASEWERNQHDEFIDKFLRRPNRGEARQWLSGDEKRNIGEMTPDESREFIEKAYKTGAIKILAVEIENETSNCLIVYLPSAGSKRKRLFEWNFESAQKCGFDPYDDWGQNELFVYFS